MWLFLVSFHTGLCQTGAPLPGQAPYCCSISTRRIIATNSTSFISQPAAALYPPSLVAFPIRTLFFFLLSRICAACLLSAATFTPARLSAVCTTHPSIRILVAVPFEDATKSSVLPTQNTTHLERASLALPCLVSCAAPKLICCLLELVLVHVAAHLPLLPHANEITHTNQCDESL